MGQLAFHWLYEFDTWAVTVLVVFGGSMRVFQGATWIWIVGRQFGGHCLFGNSERGNLDMDGCFLLTWTDITS